MNICFELHISSVKMSQHAKYLNQNSIGSKVIVRTHRQTNTTDRLLHRDHEDNDNDGLKQVAVWPSGKLKPNYITLPGSKLVRRRSQTGSKPNSITLSGSKLVGDQLRTRWRNGIWLLVNR